jgi:hypothetical protein
MFMGPILYIDMRLYIWHCDHCEQLTPTTAILAKSKDKAWDKGMQDLVKEHELTQHPDIFDLPKGRVVRMVPASKAKK